VEEMARKEIPAAKTYKLSWDCPRWTGTGEKAGDSPKCAFSVSFQRDKKRKPVPPAEKRLCSRASAVPHGGGLVRNLPCAVRD
jgi:hypothetical protein